VDKPYRVGLAGALALGAFNLFFHLHDSQIMVWDESLHGILAQEMLESGRFIVTTYNGEPDDFFRKPPLGLGLIATSYRALGYTPIALRRTLRPPLRRHESSSQHCRA
jgi:4-amino-4-deoxy-L-arabinose transferase-like glycosyltransferase